jgi:hypothetical protein
VPRCRWPAALPAAQQPRSCRRHRTF